MLFLAGGDEYRIALGETCRFPGTNGGYVDAEPGGWVEILQSQGAYAYPGVYKGEATYPDHGPRPANIDRNS